MSEETTLLVPFESYEENAVNIGTQQKSADMARFIDTVREDGLYLLNVNMTCLLYTSPSPRDATLSRMPSSA